MASRSLAPHLLKLFLLYRPARPGAPVSKTPGVKRPGHGSGAATSRAKARCITATDDSPVLSGCQPDCANIARTGPDIEELRARLARIPDDSLAPPIRHQRTGAVRESIQSIIETQHDGTP